MIPSFEGWINIYKPKNINSFGVIKTNGKNFVSCKEKPVRYENINAGIYILDTKVLKYIQTQWTGVTSTNNLVAFATLETVTSAGGSGTVSTLTNPEIQYDSGDTIYVEDRAPISRATDQTENIKLIVEF